MGASNKGANTAGSQWRRWDPHLHAPGTILNDQYGGDWEAFLKKIEDAAPAVSALGVTDYFCIQGYRAVLAHKVAGRLKNIGLIFPNVEMRLDIKTEKAKGINLHLLFSPHDPDHEAQIERLLSQLKFEFKDTQYSCTPAGLAQLGRAFHGKPITDDAVAISMGANQFKATLSDLKALFKDPWMQANALVAVAGSSNDGTAGLQADNSFAATRQSIERFAHIIFSGNPKQRLFWLGKSETAAVAHIEKTYGFLKPCLIGSDAHEPDKVAEPAQQRYCWLKGDLTFETLRQAVIEPDARVWIGSSRPSSGLSALAIRNVEHSGADWLSNNYLELNPGLVAIIGARGSGKTALVEVIATGTSAIGQELSDSSFLRRASVPVNYLAGASVRLTWGDGNISGDRLDRSTDDCPDDLAAPAARYLSQQFVNQLCSGDGLAVELRQEIERVVFEAIDPSDRMETDAFDDLAQTMLSPIQSRQQQLRDHIEGLSEQVAAEEINQRALPGLELKQKEQVAALDKLRKELAALLPKDKEAHAKQLQQLEGIYRTVEQKLEALNLRQQKIAELTEHVSDIRQYSEPQRWNEMRGSYAGTGLSAPQWDAFKMGFSGDVDAVLKTAGKAVTQSIAVVKTGDPAKPVDLAQTPTTDWPLNELAGRLEAARKAVGIDATAQQKYDTLLRKIRFDETVLLRLNTQITAVKGADQRKTELLDKRRAAYLDVFKSVGNQEEVLKKLYAPLAKELQGAQGALSKLAVVVYRRADLTDWANRGEQFIDLRVAEKLKGKGTLKKEAERMLLKAWTKGSPGDVAAAMEAFRKEYSRDFLTAMPKSLTQDERSRQTQEVAAWLYDTSHIRVEYGIQFDGVAIEKLSPGTRGIVLLLLYLAIDKRDQRPLIVDQPEENLDPQSVYEELVPHFREAAKRRQVILVTHNANLVVNTDADQVIIASSQSTGAEGLPKISYRSGALENPDIRKGVCDILEGGDRAFLERERRYRFRWEETISSVSGEAD